MIGRTVPGPHPIRSRTFPKDGTLSKFEKSGYVTERRIVVLLGNESQRVSVVLTMAAGMLKVSTVPGGASIYVDGELRREVTPANLKIPAGTRRILLRKEGYQDVEQVIEIEDNSITTMNQQLAHAAGPDTVSRMRCFSRARQISGRHGALNAMHHAADPALIARLPRTRTRLLYCFGATARNTG